MPDKEQIQGQAAVPAYGSGDAAALAAFADAAKGFQAMQAQAAMEALKLPNPRLDHPQGPTFFLVDNGDGTTRKVKPDGTPAED